MKSTCHLKYTISSSFQSQLHTHTHEPSGIMHVRNSNFTRIRKLKRGYPIAVKWEEISQT